RGAAQEPREVAPATADDDPIEEPERFCEIGRLPRDDARPEVLEDPLRLQDGAARGGGGRESAVVDEVAHGELRDVDVRWVAEGVALLWWLGAVVRDVQPERDVLHVAREEADLAADRELPERDAPAPSIREPAR